MDESLFNKILKEKPTERDDIQKKLLQKIQKITGRKTISYIANFRTFPFNMIDHDDKSKIRMLVDSIKGADKIDFILHSPGGYAEETEIIVNILRREFSNIRFIIPHSAKSAATMMALSGNEILMSSCAELGPIDPQVSGIINAPAQTIIDGFDEIKRIVDDEGKLNGAFVPLLSKMDVATLKKCNNSIDYARDLVKTWLRKYMYSRKKYPARKALRTAKFFSNHNNFLTHNKPISLEMIKSTAALKPLRVKDIEKVDAELAAAVWEYYYRFEVIMSPPSPTKRKAPIVKAVARPSASVG